MTTGPRDRLIDTAIELVREQGVHAAGLAALLERSKSSRNSLYQHFPSGKSELIAAATRIAGQRMSAVLDRAAEAGPPQQVTRSLTGWWKRTLERAAFGTGCPIMGAALAQSEPQVQAAAAEALTDWTERLAKALATRGLSPDRARSLAGFTISALEGAIIQARALKSTQPLDDVDAHLTVLFEHYLNE